MASRNRGPVAPIRAIFHDVVPAQKRDVPTWMKKGSPGPASSLPPTSAAALLHDSSKPSLANDTAPYNAHPRKTPGTSKEADPLLDARIKSASLADEVSESWIPPEEHEDPTNEVHQAVSALRAAIVDLAETKNRLLRELEPQLISLARMIAERVLESHLPRDDKLPHRLVQEGLNCLDHNGLVTVVLGPGFSAHASNLKQELKRDGVECDVHVQEHLALYSCQIRTELGAVDESIETRLDKLLASLTDNLDAE